MKNKNIIISTVAGTLVVATVISFIGCKWKKNEQSPYQGNSIVFTDEIEKYSDLESTVEFFENNIHTSQTFSEIVDNTTTTVNITQNENINSYDENLHMLNQILNKKDFDSEEKQLIVNSYNLIYQNYSAFYNSYKLSGIPTCDEYIKSNFIDVIEKNLDELTIYKMTDDSLSLFRDADGYYDINTKSMKLLDRSDPKELITLFLHELTHGFQKEFLNSEVSKNLQMNQNSLWLILVEGEPDITDTIVYNTIQCMGNYVVESKDENCYLRLYGKTSDKQYNLYYKFYSMFSHMAGYSEMQNLKEQGDINLLINSMTQKYGKDCSEFVFKCTDLISHINAGKEDSVYISDAIDYIDNFYLSCLSLEIENVDSKDSAIDMLNYYRYYKLQEQTKYVKETSDGNIDITEQKYNFTPIEDKLFEKCIEYNVFNGLDEDNQINRSAFSSILKIDSSNLVVTLEPICLNGRQYKLLEEEGKIVLYYDECAIFYDMNGADKERVPLRKLNTDGAIEFIDSKSVEKHATF